MPSHSMPMPILALLNTRMPIGLVNLIAIPFPGQSSFTAAQPSAGLCVDSLSSHSHPPRQNTLPLRMLAASYCGCAVSSLNSPARLSKTRPHYSATTRAQLHLQNRVSTALTQSTLTFVFISCERPLTIVLSPWNTSIQMKC